MPVYKHVGFMKWLGISPLGCFKGVVQTEPMVTFEHIIIIFDSTFEGFFNPVAAAPNNLTGALFSNLVPKLDPFGHSVAALPKATTMMIVVIVVGTMTETADVVMRTGGVT